MACNYYVTMTNAINCVRFRNLSAERSTVEYWILDSFLSGRLCNDVDTVSRGLIDREQASRIEGPVASRVQPMNYKVDTCH